MISFRTTLAIDESYILFIFKRYFYNQIPTAMPIVGDDRRYTSFYV